MDLYLFMVFRYTWLSPGKCAKRRRPEPKLNEPLLHLPGLTEEKIGINLSQDGQPLASNSGSPECEVIVLSTEVRPLDTILVLIKSQRYSFTKRPTREKKRKKKKLSFSKSPANIRITDLGPKWAASGLVLEEGLTTNKKRYCRVLEKLTKVPY